MIYIYTLTDPRDGRVRYVGKTNNKETRLANHISNAKTIKHNRHVCNWIKELLALGLKPVFKVIEECVDNWAEREVSWIAHYKAIGCKLTNNSIGGESGALGVTHTEEYKENLSKIMKGNTRAKGAIKSLEHRAKLSKNNKRAKAVLTEQEVILVCQLINQGLKGRVIKKQVPNIKPHILWNIKNGKSWIHLTKIHLNGKSIS